MQRYNTESRAYPCKCLTCGCLETTGMSNLRLPNNDGIRPNTSQYVVCARMLFQLHVFLLSAMSDKIERRAHMKLSVNNGKCATKTLEIIHETFGEYSLSRTAVVGRDSRLRTSGMSDKVDERSRRPDRA
jgi:hypothetical protein